MPGYAHAVRTLAATLKLPIIDVYDAFQTYGAVKEQSAQDLLLDGMHPNAKGQRPVADLLIKEIVKLKTSES
jgi:lysophospholipase L1-like esterase